MLLALAFIAYGAPPSDGETLPNGQRTGWWPVSSESGRVLGETRYEEGVAVEGLGAPVERPRCLAEPPPDGLYACLRCDKMLTRPVAVVGGCVGATAGETWNHGVSIAGRNRFLVVDSDGERCLTGRTADYQVVADGLEAVVRTWTQCVGGSERGDEVFRVGRIEEIGEGAFDHSEESVRAAALESFAARQPEEEACEPLGRAIRGSLGPQATLRAVQVATAPCLARDLRVALLEHRYEAAADPLARLSDDPADDLLDTVAAGMPGATLPLARRLADDGPIEPKVMSALAGALVDGDGTDQTRRAATTAINDLFSTAGDGEALLAAADQGGSCEGWRMLLETAAVKASGLGAPKRVSKRCD